ncbi:metallophosphoesterase family protein [Deinococcus peraridilitoris]|uniref:Phosphoesterase n=1 Tax=Deinococcus peraridilitoris (strain DSM 19664 / LMG 22246 / CIP 109416 / KR-200) TaxID=937777 RepID=L0A519_DEIPD|nr:metallophosphoesterase family protein [Deinococcus peraridilitoris]AFZ68272.1 phosphoesterase, MJ0936 family [Deinococcus peraridilitoris DSM 19664]
MQVGVISDTHGLLRPEALAALAGSDLILHAGDVGKPEILARLADLAPTLAVRGNVDRSEWARDLPETLVHVAAGVWFYLLHDVRALDLSPGPAGFRVVVSGHSHRASLEERAGVLYLNPGAAGPRRFRLPLCVALLHLEGGEVRTELRELSVRP